MATPVHDLGTFNRLLMSAGGKLVAVDFTATWCGPCKMIGPEFERLAKQHLGTCVFLKVDVDQARDVASAYSVSSMPTFKFFKHGKLIDEFKGANLPKLEEIVSSHAAYTPAFTGGGMRLGGGDGAGSSSPWGRVSPSEEDAAALARERLSAAKRSAAGPPPMKEILRRVSSTEAVPAAEPVQRDSKAAAGQVQVRMPDGTKLQGEFGPDDNLKSLARLVVEHRPEFVAPFSFLQLYPKKKYPPADFDRISLKEASLYPRGTVSVVIEK